MSTAVPMNIDTGGGSTSASVLAPITNNTTTEKAVQRRKRLKYMQIAEVTPSGETISRSIVAPKGIYKTPHGYRVQLNMESVGSGAKSKLAATSAGAAGGEKVGGGGVNKEVSPALTRDGSTVGVVSPTDSTHECLDGCVSPDGAAHSQPMILSSPTSVPTTASLVASKGKFSRNTKKFEEAVWLYEVAILISDLPSDVQMIVLRGNYSFMITMGWVTDESSYLRALEDQIAALVQGKMLTNMEYALAVEAYNKLSSNRGIHGVVSHRQDLSSFARDVVGGKTNNRNGTGLGPLNFNPHASNAQQQLLRDNRHDNHYQQQQYQYQQQYHQSIKHESGVDGSVIPKFNFPASQFDSDNGRVNYDEIRIESNAPTPRETPRGLMSGSGLNSGFTSGQNSECITRLPSLDSHYGGQMVGRGGGGGGGGSNSSTMSSGTVTRMGTFGSTHSSSSSNNALLLSRDNTESGFGLLSRNGTLTGEERLHITSPNGHFSRAGSSVVGGGGGGGGGGGVNNSNRSTGVFHYPLSRAGSNLSNTAVHNSTASEHYYPNPANSHAGSIPVSQSNTSFHTHQNTPRTGYSSCRGSGSGDDDITDDLYGSSNNPDGQYQQQQRDYNTSNSNSYNGNHKNSAGMNTSKSAATFAPSHHMHGAISEKIENKSLSALDLLVNTVMYISKTFDGDSNSGSSQAGSECLGGTAAGGGGGGGGGMGRESGSTGNNSRLASARSAGSSSGYMETFPDLVGVPTGTFSSQANNFSPRVYGSAGGDGGGGASGPNSARSHGGSLTGPSREFDPWTITVPRLSSVQMQSGTVSNSYKDTGSYGSQSQSQQQQQQHTGLYGSGPYGNGGARGSSNSNNNNNNNDNGSDKVGMKRMNSADSTRSMSN